MTRLLFLTAALLASSSALARPSTADATADCEDVCEFVGTTWSCDIDAGSGEVDADGVLRMIYSTSICDPDGSTAATYCAWGQLPYGGNFYCHLTPVQGLTMTHIVVDGSDNRDHIWLHDDPYGPTGSGEFLQRDGAHYTGLEVVVHGLGGHDIIHGSDETDNGYLEKLHGDAGRDVINAHDGGDIVFGGSGNDILSGMEGQDTIYGNGGRDRISGNDGNDIIDGGGDNDDICGDSGDDVIYGRAGDDLIDGGGESDIGWGGVGTDYCTGVSSAYGCPIDPTIEPDCPTTP